MSPPVRWLSAIRLYLRQVSTFMQSIIMLEAAGTRPCPMSPFHLDASANNSTSSSLCFIPVSKVHVEEEVLEVFAVTDHLHVLRGCGELCGIEDGNRAEPNG